VLTRPNIAIGNGIAASALLLPLKILGTRVFVSFHGYVGRPGPLWDLILKTILAACDVVYVNSRTSHDDLVRVVPESKLVTVELWADECFFEVPLQGPLNKRLVILYVGRLDDEKFEQCLRVTTGLAADALVELWAVGSGPLGHELTAPGVRYFGYVTDRYQLADIYAHTDVVWAPADTTYLSRPGVEGLAAGRPVIVSDVPAVDARAAQGARVPRSLVPPEIGWVVDGEDDFEVVQLIRRLAKSGVPTTMRAACRAYALRFHSTANLARVLASLRPSGS
jgi:glycosyltransferase involved in cell wall biosynthesis